MSDERTLIKESGLPRQFGDMVEAFCEQYRGGISRLELAKGHTDVKSRFYDFLNALADEHQATLPHEKRSAWRTVNIGGTTAAKLRDATKGVGMRVSDWAFDLMTKIRFAGEVRQVKLYRVTLRELGFTEKATKDEIYARALSLGYILLPEEVGPQLRLQYPEQPKGEYLWVATEPITGSDGYPDVFNVDRDVDGRWLNGNYVNPDNTWNPDDSWVFGRNYVHFSCLTAGVFVSN